MRTSADGAIDEAAAHVNAPAMAPDDQVDTERDCPPKTPPDWCPLPDVHSGPDDVVPAGNAEVPHRTWGGRGVVGLLMRKSRKGKAPN
jgi:hypothetical protein